MGIIWYYITRIPAVNCICSTSLVNLQGPMSPCSFNGCGPAVLFPRGSCVCTVCKMFTEEFPKFTFLIQCDFVWKATFLLQLLLNFAINMYLKQNGLTYDFRAHALE